jgi:type II secretory pathway component PulF
MKTYILTARLNNSIISVASIPGVVIAFVIGAAVSIPMAVVPALHAVATYA